MERMTLASRREVIFLAQSLENAPKDRPEMEFLVRFHTTASMAGVAPPIKKMTV